MKKTLLKAFLFIFVFSTVNIAFAETDFVKALRTCEKYSQTGTVSHSSEVFTLTITLDPKANNRCQYKEKISQGKDFELLTCNFDKAQLPFMAESMQKFSNIYKKEMLKNKIYEAKMTTNAEVFNKYLANPKYCTITHSKK